MGTRANFGIDAPGVIRNFLLLAVAAAALAWASAHYLPHARGLPRMFGSFAAWFGFFAMLMLWTSLFGKRIAAKRLIARAALAGDERVLDVGCGRGLLLLGAARQLPRGRAVGLDLWNASDLSGNERAATEANARVLAVADRVEVVDGDMRAMPFADAEFDAVVSSLAIHNVYEGEGREAALREITRVLKPGGRVLLQDFRHTADYARALRDAGFEEVERKLVNPLLMFPPTWRVSARKPESG